MRLTAIVAFVAAVHVGSTPLAAQQPANGLPPVSSFASQFAPKRTPPSEPRFLFPTPAPTLNPRPKPAVACGLTLIPGDPNVDGGIRREIPADGPRYSIRPVDPKLCATRP